MTHLALILTVCLLAVTGYLAWEGQRTAHGAREELRFMKEQQKAMKSARPDQGSLVALPSQPSVSVTPAAPPPEIDRGLDDPELLAGLAGLPGGGLTVPPRVAAAEQAGISTGTMSGLQKRVLAAAPVAKVKTVVKEQGFVVLDGGKNRQLAKGMKLEVRRSGSILGRLTVTDAIEEEEAVADIDIASIPTGVSIEPGDEVILPAER